MAQVFVARDLEVIVKSVVDRLVVNGAVLSLKVVERPHETLLGVGLLN